MRLLRLDDLIQDFHFGSWIRLSISQTPKSWSSEAQFFLREPSFGSAKRKFHPLEKTEIGELLLFSHFEKHLSGPHPWSA
ncbi:MAG: hypothetical protein ACLQVM_00255 [Terriglobia bacterium]